MGTHTSLCPSWSPALQEFAADKYAKHRVDGRTANHEHAEQEVIHRLLPVTSQIIREHPICNALFSGPQQRKRWAMQLFFSELRSNSLVLK